ncbi:hypothetical protein FLB_14920 [Flavobacterium succinicans]|uniref:Uncharacterized protein n=1 Tax=Flavobacterium succinicans TaxID=29536 RepID=A0A199XQ86_9FLAO|nr:hypothetical protein FLB_14920 [Flavobacterium succinicans]
MDNNSKPNGIYKNIKFLNIDKYLKKLHNYLTYIDL